jgi:hypothetical protein
MVAGGYDQLRSTQRSMVGRSLRRLSERMSSLGGARVSRGKPSEVRVIGG